MVETGKGSRTRQPGFESQLFQLGADGLRIQLPFLNLCFLSAKWVENDSLAGCKGLAPSKSSINVRFFPLYNT